MGKVSRRSNRRNRHEPKQDRSALTVTVGVSPSLRPSGQPSLVNELRLLRSSLLYADHVNLIAPSAAWMRDFTPFKTVHPEDPWQSVAAMPPETLLRLGVTDVGFREFRRQMRRIGRKPADDPQRLEGEQLWKPSIVKLKQQAAEVFDTKESDELDMVLEAGSVTLISDGTRFEEALDQQVDWFRERLMEALADPSSTVLLDEITSDFLNTSGRHSVGLPTVANDRSRRAAVGTGLVERLPVFPDAPMSHILEAREELAEGRSEYRESVRELSGKLQSSAMDATLTSEIDELWYDSVRPKLRKLQKSTIKTRLMHGTGVRLIDELHNLPTVLVAVVGIGELADALPDLATAAAATTRVAVAGAKEAFQAHSTVREHDLVYLLDVNKKLGNAPIQ